MPVEKGSAFLLKVGNGATPPVFATVAGLAGLKLGWSPDAFWRATPADLAAVIAALKPTHTLPPDAATIATLQATHPDGGAGG